MRPLDATRRQRVNSACEEASDLLKEIEPSLFPWAGRECRVEQRLNAALAKTGEKAGQFPRQWVELTLSQIAVVSVLHSPALTEKYLAANRGRLTDAAAGFVRRFIERPAFLTAFSAAEQLGDGIFEITDFSDGARHLLYSTSLAGLSRQRLPSLLTLFFSNGECLQTYGPLHYYRGFERIDFHYYAKMLRPQAYAAGGPAAVMNELPESFVILDAFTEIPPIVHHGERLYCCSSTLAADSFNPSGMSDEFDVTESRGVTRCRLKGSDSPMETADLYWDSKKRQVVCHAWNMADYSRIVGAAAGQVALPSEPQLHCTQNMEMAAAMLLGRQPLLFPYERHFVDETPDLERNAELKKVNAFYAELADAHNHGRSFSIEEAAVRAGLPLETAREAARALNDQMDERDIKVEGGLEGIPILSPAQRMKLGEDLGSCTLFRLSKGNEAQTLFSDVAEKIQPLLAGARATASLAALPEILEDLDDPYWEDPQNTVLKYSLYLLCHAGAELQSTNDYAAEILRLFWQVLIDEPEHREIRHFNKEYAIWCRELLVRAGLVEAEEGGAPEKPGAPGARRPDPRAKPGAPGARNMDERARPGAPFRIRTTPFFRAWISVRQSRPR
jgi:hypothetical protein